MSQALTQEQPGPAGSDEGATKAAPRFSLRTALSELFIIAGILLLLFAFYEAFWTNIAAGKLQDQAQEALDDKWADENAPVRPNPRGISAPELGDAFARMYVPVYGSDWNFALLEGTNEDTLVAGPGRYEQTQMPAEPGNFALAGHRVGKGAPFNDLGQLNSCDAIVVETATQWITYRVLPMSTNPASRAEEATDCFAPHQLQRIAEGDYAGVQGRKITLPSDVGVLNPIPNVEAEQSAEMEHLLTLTTCHPQFSNAQRMIIHAMATEVLPKEHGVQPDAMKGI